MLDPQLEVMPILVPHRDESTETVGFEIKGAHKTAVFIADTDKWSKWPQRLPDLVQRADYLLRDATFYRNGKLPRDMAEVPHPFVEETIKFLQNLPTAQRTKVYFIHFNHTNALLNPASPERAEVLRQGFCVAGEGLVPGL